MIKRFEIVGPNSVRPNAKQIIFCDGTGGSLFRADTDLELSHWRPNRTPVEYRAGTSTEICFRFLDDPRPGEWTVAVNNHVDVDGILSVYVLMKCDHARAHRRAICEAASMGDFWGWGDPPAQRVFQGVTRLMNAGGDARAVYSQAFSRIPTIIDGSDVDLHRIEDSLAPLRHGVELVEQGRITRLLISSRLALYVVPRAVAGDEDDRVSHVPEFNEEISPRALFWPQVRARWDAERAALVSVERESGWFHDLWLPGYHWADTEGLWRVPGLTYHDGMESYELDNPALIAAFERLQQYETQPGQWALGGTPMPLGNELQSRFPLVGRFVDERCHAVVSRQSPEQVASRFAGVFD